MALVQYTDTFWFPDGSLAGGVVARVFLHSVNTLAPLWADAGGTIPVANPTVTSAGGVLTFWIEEGAYWLHLDTESFELTLPQSSTGPFLPLAGGTMTGAIAMTGGSVDIDVQQSISTAVSTGVISGGLFTINGGNPGAVDISAMVAYVVDYITDPLNPVVQRVTTPAQTVVMTDVVNTVTYWSISSAGAVLQSPTEPTNAQRRTQLYLAASAQAAGTIFTVVPTQVTLNQWANQEVDLLESLGAFPISGNTISANGANLSIGTTGGPLFARSRSMITAPGNPHVGFTTAASPAQFRRGLQNTTNFGAAVSVLDPANYDNGGVLTAVGGGVNRATIQRVYAFISPNQPDQMVVLYGQAVYSSLAGAIAAATAESFNVNAAVAANGTLVGLVAVIRSATNLSDPTQAVFLQIGKFGGGASAASTVGADFPGATRTVDKTGDESRTSTIVLSNDTHLFMTVSANARYTVEMFLDVEADPNADIAFGFTAPAGSTMSWGEGGVSLGTLNNIGSVKLNRNALATASSVGVILAGTTAMPTGRLTVGVTAGTLQFQFAQVVSSVTATVLKAGTWMRLTRIA